MRLLDQHYHSNDNTETFTIVFSLFSSSNQIMDWDLSGAEITLLARFLFNIYAPRLPQLRHLILDKSTIDIIKHIASAALQLQTLETHLLIDVSSSELILSMPQLNRLILEIKSKHSPTSRTSILLPHFS